MYDWHWMVATVEAQTDNAILLSTNTTKQWIPYKMLKAITSELVVGETQRLAIPTAMAQRKGFTPRPNPAPVHLGVIQGGIK